MANCKCLGMILVFLLSLDVGEDAALGDGDPRQKLVQLLVVTDGQLQVPWDDPGLFVVPGGVSCQLQNLCRQVLHHGRQVDGGASTDAFRVIALPQKTMDPANGKLEASAAGSGLCLSLNFSSFASSGHLGEF